MRTLPVLLLAGLTLTNLSAHAEPGGNPSDASAELSIAPSVAAASAVLAIAPAGAHFVVTSVRQVGRATWLTLQGVGGSFEVAVDLSATGVRSAAELSGRTLESVATASGHLLVCAGEAIAFIPDEATRHAIHHRRVG